MSFWINQAFAQRICDRICYPCGDPSCYSCPVCPSVTCPSWTYEGLIYGFIAGLAVWFLASVLGPNKVKYSDIKKIFEDEEMKLENEINRAHQPNIAEKAREELGVVKSIRSKIESKINK
jgi:hypothetical protein